MIHDHGDGSFCVGENPPCEHCGGYVTHTVEVGTSASWLLCADCAYGHEDALIASGTTDYRVIWLGIEEGE